MAKFVCFFAFGNTNLSSWFVLNCGLCLFLVFLDMGMLVFSESGSNQRDFVETSGSDQRDPFKTGC